MKISIRHWLARALLISVWAFGAAAYAQNETPPAPSVDVEAPDRSTAPAATDANAEHAAADADASSAPERGRNRTHDKHKEDDVVAVGSDARLEAGKHAGSVVSVLGSSTSEGDVHDAVVSVLGDTTVSGSTGDAIAVLGRVTLNGKAKGDVVAIMGNVTLGPNAEVGGDVVVIGGQLERDPTAVIRGRVENVFAFTSGMSDWLRPWVQHCLLYLRPLAFQPGLGWAWTLALGFLAFYVLIGFLFPDAVDRSVRTLDEQPGRCVIAALLSILLTPVLIALLFITVIGIAFVPFAILGAYLLTLFGKAVMLAWIGKRILHGVRSESPAITGLSVLVGGAIVLLLYVVPVLGFVVYKALGILGFGVVVYASIVAMKARRADVPPSPVSASDSAAFTANASDASTAQSSAAYESSSERPGMSADSPPPPPPGGTSAHAPRSEAADTEANLLAVSTYPRASFGVRMVALFIDAVLIALVLGMIHNSRQAELLVLATYGAVMWKLKGTTIGGIVFGLKVMRADGRPIDWPTATVRALSCFLSLVIAGLGFIWIAIDDGRQGWHDKIAGTVVVRVPKGMSLL